VVVIGLSSHQVDYRNTLKDDCPGEKPTSIGEILHPATMLPQSQHFTGKCW
jgi:hypothetical protein